MCVDSLSCVEHGIFVYHLICNQILRTYASACQEQTLDKHERSAWNPFRSTALHLIRTDSSGMHCACTRHAIEAAHSRRPPPFTAITPEKQKPLCLQNASSRRLDLAPRFALRLFLRHMSTPCVSRQTSASHYGCRKPPHSYWSSAMG